MPIIKKLEELSGKSYSNSEHTHAFRVIADHVRAALMLAVDNVEPSNKEQGYFSRRLLRRAIRYGKQLGIEQLFLADLVPVIVDLYKNHYPETLQKKDHISQIFTKEEKKFNRTLEKGLKEFNKIEMETLTAGHTFKLYETYGFPIELSIEEAEREGISVSENLEENFQKLKDEHAAKSRQASAGSFKGGLADQSENTIKYHTATHLLHAALRKVLGTHVEQKGSNITGKRLRFDFSHPEKMSDDEKKQVEQLVNHWVEAALPVSKDILEKQAALDSGAIAFFIEKYPDEVSVYTIGHEPNGAKDDEESGWISKEFCGGPHVQNTSEIGKLELFKEQSASSGVRRVYLRLASS